MTIFLNTPNLSLYILIAVALILTAVVINLHIKVKRLLIGKNGKTLEDSFIALKKGLDAEIVFKKEMQTYLSQVEKRLARSTRGIATVRFNAFAGTGTGGNQSFATAYVNELGDGVIISSLNARERVSVFAKPLKKFQSEFELSPEETEALANAKESLAI